jgi:divalent metal cation (Fe/Co/Zn/Cd) transporter
MSEFVQIGISGASCSQTRSNAVFWLQGVTLAWMLVEAGVSIYAAITAHSPVLLAFGSDSVVELLSASVVLAQWIPGILLAPRKAARASAILLYILALVVSGVAFISLFLKIAPEVSFSGIAITIAALIAMPILAALKRREARRSGNAALAADAVQSATCAYLALIALAGLVANAALHLAWLDSAAALLAVPILVKEGRSAWQGNACSCC